ncbi:hypothetical protein JJB09_21075 [Rhizobium sp. KVB221]|uniref:Glucose uptake protein n=1 Tax=Rhizobium setariae TaxID=2801340 RepID=A0A937CMN0_9HYPH|nr:hypothetical protein [Rhizobium setariae]MBL0374510.1 hypothetical protein [Rhizobium setariae]
MKLGFIVWLLTSSAIFMAAATSSRAYVSTNNVLWVVFSMCLYVTGNLIMLKLMREGGLGLAISISAITQLILVNLIAFSFYGERLSSLQVGGLVLGVAAMVLMMWPSTGSA